MSRKPNAVTVENLIAIAAKYKTKKEFRQQDASNYSNMVRHKAIDVCCAHMKELRKPDGYWTLERCKAEAAKYNSQAEWRKSSDASVQIAHKNGWIRECTAHMQITQKPYGYWTAEKCLEASKPYKNSQEWKDSDKHSYDAAIRLGVLAECKAHMSRKYPDALLKWDKESCLASAKKYNTVADWKRAEAGAYKRARELGYKTECIAHMEDRRPSDNDAIYCWKAVGLTYNGKQVYKVGVTSARLGNQRIQMVAAKARIEYEIVFLLGGFGCATDIEDEMLLIGDDPLYCDMDGATEFRALSDEQLEQVKIIAYRI